MTRVVYIGDEVTAAGFRLAGLEVRVTDPGGAGEALRQALAGDDDCVLFSGQLTDDVPPALLRQALEGIEPPFAVVPDVRGLGAPPDLVLEVRNALGIEA
ncbi:MAG TPA: V-type ATP synthase subunit F [Steroidobacteraceae bacterium]|nr:V-type ATP synthase subunit F [Steroidobacteraceae bacterium]